MCVFLPELYWVKEHRRYSVYDSKLKRTFNFVGTGFELPPVAANALNMQPTPPGVLGGPPGAAAVPGAAPQAVAAPPIATQCFMLSNMFDPTT